MNNEETEILNECFDALYYNVAEKLKVEASSFCFGIDITPKCFGEQYIGSRKYKHNNIKRKKENNMAYKKIFEESVDYIGIDNNYHTKKRYRVLQRDIDTNLWQLSTFVNTNFEEVPAIFDDKDSAIAFAKGEIGMIHLREIKY